VREKKYAENQVSESSKKKKDRWNRKDQTDAGHQKKKKKKDCYC
jgi:hypothetical protein